MSTILFKGEGGMLEMREPFSREDTKGKLPVFDTMLTLNPDDQRKPEENPLLKNQDGDMIERYIRAAHRSRISDGDNEPMLLPGNVYEEKPLEGSEE